MMRREGMDGVLELELGGAAAASLDLALTPERLSLQTLGQPAFLMSLPLFLSADEPNNVLMEAMSGEERRVDCRKATAQFLDLYRFISARAVVYLLPSRPGLQDQPYVANLGAVLPHTERETVVVSRFRSPPRVGEVRRWHRLLPLVRVRRAAPASRRSTGSRSISRARPI